MLLLLLNYVVLRALWKIDVYLISTPVNISLYYKRLYQKIYTAHVIHSFLAIGIWCDTIAMVSQSATDLHLQPQSCPLCAKLFGESVT